MNTGVSARHTRAALIVLGTTAVVSQIILLREFLGVFHGNELIIGLVLGCWMILTGLGALLGRAAGRWIVRLKALPLVLLALGIAPILTVMLVRFLPSVLFTRGGMIPIVQAFVLTAVLLAPFCCAAGLSFTIFAGLLAGPKEQNATAAAYGWESLGSAAGGLLFSLYLLPRLDTFQALSILLLISAAGASFLAVVNAWRGIVLITVSALITGTYLLVFGQLDRLTRQFLFPGQSIAFFRDTPYGNLTVTRQDGQISVFENHMLMFATNDAVANEENVHYAMVQRPSPRTVLLIGGGIAGTTLEILKYDVDHVDYAEMNPWTLEIGRTFTHVLGDPRIRVINDDGRRFVRSTDQRYDVALINLPDPETIQLNRFYTSDFFHALAKVLTDSAVLSISLLPGTEYQGPEARSTTSILYATLRQSFGHVLIVPGMRNYFLASNRPLEINIGQLMSTRNVRTAYVNSYYLDDRMLQQRSQELLHSCDPAAPLNTDVEPILYYRLIAYWLSFFGVLPGLWVLLVAGALVLLIWRISAVGVGIFVGGLVSASLEILLLLVFQTLAGSLYQMLGIVITAFMAGLAAGSWSARRFLPRAGMRGFVVLQLVVGITCVLLPVLFHALRTASLSDAAMQVLFSGLAFCLALLFGMEFALASSARGGPATMVASDLYGLDLAGSSLGALTIGVYAIPLWGLTNTSVSLGLASFVAAGVCIVERRRR